MTEVGGRPLLWHIMKLYSAHGINDFIVCLGYKGYVIKEYFMNYFLHNSDITVDLANNRTEIHGTSSEPFTVTLVETGLNTKTAGRLQQVKQYIGDEDLRRIIQAAQNKCEGFNQFAQWVYFGADTITENVRDDQLKIIKYNHLIANLVIFHNCHTITQALKELEAEGMKLTPELIACFSPFRTGHLNRFGLFDLRERYPLPVDYGVMFEV